MLIDRRAGLLSDLELDRAAGLSLADSCPLDRIAVWRDVIGMTSMRPSNQLVALPMSGFQVDLQGCGQIEAMAPPL